MRTAYAPKSHTELASTSVGIPYGHVPGHHYHDVNVVISKRGGKYRVHVCESWGSAQGYDEEHGRIEVIGRGEDIDDAASGAKAMAKEARIQPDYLSQALSQAVDEAHEAEADRVTD